MALPLILATSPVGIGDSSWTVDFTAVDLIAAGTDALNGAQPAAATGAEA